MACNAFRLDERRNPDNINEVRVTGGRVTLAIRDCRKPVIAAVRGAAVGIDTTMTLERVLTADLVPAPDA